MDDDLETHRLELLIRVHGGDAALDHAGNTGALSKHLMTERLGQTDEAGSEMRLWMQGG